MAESEVEPRLRWAEQVAAEVGRLLLASFRSGIAAERKDRGIVTELDRRAEALIAASLREAFPEDGLLAEEGTQREAPSGWAWVADPLDGTTNYVAGLPLFAVSLACTDPGGRGAALGVVHAPALGDTFTAIRGKAPPAGQRPGPTDLASAVFILNKAYHPAARLWEVSADLLGAVRAFRTFGCVSLDLALVAAGQADGLVLLPADPWDVAAGLLLATEAGIRTGDLAGAADPDGRRGILAAAPALFSAAAALLHPEPFGPLAG